MRNILKVKGNSIFWILIVIIFSGSIAFCQEDKNNKPGYKFSLLWKRTFNVNELGDGLELGIFKTGPTSGVEKIFSVSVMNETLLGVTTAYIYNKAIQIIDGQIIDIDVENGYVEFKIGKVYLFNESGSLFEKPLTEELYISGISKDKRHILLNGKTKGQLFSSDGTLLWEKQRGGTYRFSQDGKLISVSSNDESGSSVLVYDLKGNPKWDKNFGKSINILFAQVFNEGQSIIISLQESGKDKVLLYDLQKGLLWQKDLKYRAFPIPLSEVGGLFFLHSGHIENGGTFDISGNLLISSKEIDKRLIASGKEIYDKRRPLSPNIERFYKNQLFLETSNDEYLIDAKGMINPLGIKEAFIKQFGKEKELKEKRNLRGAISISPDLQFLLLRSDKTLRYYKIEAKDAD